MSLRVDDPRSRGRSKSPSGRIRERSKSRDNRFPTATPEPTSQSTRQYLAADLSGDKVRTRSRTRGVSPLREHRSSSRYDHSGSDSEADATDAYRRAQRVRDRYYQSDSGESKRATRETQKYARQPQRPQAQYDAYSDDSYSLTDSDEEALAYGEAPGSLERGYYGYKGHSQTSAPPSQPVLMTGALHPSTSSAEVPGSHLGYARPEPYGYPVPPQNIPVQPNAARSGPGGSSATWAPIPDCEQPGFVPVSQGEPQSMPGAFPTPASSQPGLPVSQYVNSDASQNQYPQWTNRPLPAGVAYTYPATTAAHQRTPSGDPKAQHNYANPPAFQYANVDPNVKYTSKPAAPAKSAAYGKSSAQSSEMQQAGLRYSTNPQFSSAPPAPTIPTSRQDTGPQFVEISPGNLATTRTHSNSLTSGGNLAVAGPDPNFRPVSPMLEPYKGTYQSMSPMPSPILISSKYNEDVSDMEPLDSSSDSEKRSKRKGRKSKEEKTLKEPRSDRSKRDSSRVRHERHGSKGGPDAVVLISPTSDRRRVTFYDATQDAMDLKEALSHTRSIDTKILTHVLPNLTSEEILDLRKEYKNHVKIHGKGINLAKHIRVKLGNTSFGKVCYATALGRWESEAFWANCYYQSGTSRRELLIESLFGRSNSEMREIKESFKDSRYVDSLEKCMKAELKADKFRTAVLLALEENRQSDRDSIDIELVQRDVQALHAALVSRHGGETAMIYIIVRRSDPHLREVMRAYEKMHGRNFAREMIQKSQNLVGETLAHILNGAINRPMRDALLLHQALRESRSGRERSELLISRLVRLHWEPRHLESVKAEYRRRYGERLEEAIAEEILPSTGGADWGEFCIALAQSSKKLSGKG